MAIRDLTVKRTSNKKKVKLTEHFSKALVTGKKHWRQHLTVKQALEQVPQLLHRDIAELEKMIDLFKADVGKIEYTHQDDGLVVSTISIGKLSLVVSFGSDGKKKFRAMVGEYEGNAPKDIIERIGMVMSAHMELPRRIFALEKISELSAFLDDDNAKNSIENMLDVFDGNDLLVWNAVTATKSVFDVDLDKFLEETK